MKEVATTPARTTPPSRWKWVLAAGLLLVALGLSGVTIASLLELSSLLIFGPLLLVSSLIQLITAFLADRGKETLIHLTAAGVEAACGLLVMVEPVHRVVGLVVVVVLFLAVTGFLRLAATLGTRSRGRVWVAVAGVAALLLALAAWVSGSSAKLWLLGLCIGVDFICHGASWSAVALADQRRLQAPPA